ncbi:MAG: adenylate/guanylate cyclase domain-containing protein [Gammaproteobacteria bacterium]
MNNLAIALLIVFLLVGLGVFAWSRQLQNRRLTRRLEHATVELQKLQIAFSRFAPDAVIEKIIADGSADVGEKKEVTILFADLVGFTAMSEGSRPTDLVRILNGYFERMSQAITNRRGYVSTFIGDGILALFGAMEPNPWQGDDAVHAALDMHSALVAYNEELQAEGLPALSLGIGLERGVGVAGLVGSHDLKEFTVVGGTVNVASRVQNLTRVHPANVIVTQTLKETLDPRFGLRQLPDTAVKGIEKPLVIHAVDGYDGDQK